MRTGRNTYKVGVDVNPKTNRNEKIYMQDE